jgi:predicted component of type VI protein secretion system
VGRARPEATSQVMPEAEWDARGQRWTRGSRVRAVLLHTLNSEEPIIVESQNVNQLHPFSLYG